MLTCSAAQWPVNFANQRLRVALKHLGQTLQLISLRSQLQPPTRALRAEVVQRKVLASKASLLVLAALHSTLTQQMLRPYVGHVIQTET